MVVAAVCVVALAGCSWGRLDESSGVSTTTIPDEMRSVPTVPDPASTPAAESVVDDAATVMEAADAGAPPTTALIGDPRPNPDSTATLPPLPDAPVVDACSRLAEYSASEIVGAAAGTAVVGESMSQDACRFTGGATVAEIHFLPEATVMADWFRRDAIEPVGEVGGDVVGLLAFVPPGSSPSEGYTLALVSRRQGAVVAVSGTSDDRALAVQLATIVDGSM